MTSELRFVGLDFETYSEVDLFEEGAARYFEHPSTVVLIAATEETTVTFSTDEYTQKINLESVVTSAPIRWDFTTAHYLKNDIDRFLSYLESVAVSPTAYIVPFNQMFEMRCIAHLIREIGGQGFSGYGRITTGDLVGGINLPPIHSDFLDAAVYASAMCGGPSLEKSGRQFTTRNKLVTGKELINLFSKPKYWKDNNIALRAMTPDQKQALKTDTRWVEFMDYCVQDASLGVEIMIKALEAFGPAFVLEEAQFNSLTIRQNARGWPVDIESVKEMHKQIQDNRDTMIHEFKAEHPAFKNLNFNSAPQLFKAMEDLGLKRPKSLDKKALPKYLANLQRVYEKITANGWGHLTVTQQEQALNLQVAIKILEIKADLGGTSAAKLPTILQTVSDDGMLRDQYRHAGAGQTLRTAAQGVQMQNVMRLPEEIVDLPELLATKTATNKELAPNLRQVFAHPNPDGFLIVGDFSSVEARGLAYLAGDEDILNAFRDGKDLYKVQATKMPQYSHIPYEEITKPQRQAGKVGVLSCGYGAGAGAVKRFAEGMFINLTEDEAQEIVTGWRDANKPAVQLWKSLDSYLEDLIVYDIEDEHPIGPTYADLTIQFTKIPTPPSLRAKHTTAQSIMMTVRSRSAGTVLKRVWHGVYRKGREFIYHKASALVKGDPWLDYTKITDERGKVEYVDNKLYGGKMTGILVQSFCRQLFMISMRQLEFELRNNPGANIIGQFHDEIVVAWEPTGAMPYVGPTLDKMSDAMSGPPAWAPYFPLEADIKSARRYIK